MLRFALAVAVLCTGLFSSPAQAQPVRKALSPVKNLAQKCFGKDCQQQVAGTPATAEDYEHMHDYLQPAAFAVGGRDPLDGAIITSILPSATPTPAPALPEQTVIEGRSSRSDFRQTLLKAARQQRRDGLISAGEYFAIFAGTLNPAKLEQARLATVDSMVQDGVLAESDAIGAIDWEKLIELVIKYLPLILDLFKK